MTDRENGDDPMLDQRVRAWLGSEPDPPPDSLAKSASLRVRQVGQRPAWRARLGRRDVPSGPRLLHIGGALGSVAVAILIVSLAWQAITGPAQQTASPTSPASPSPSVSTAAPTTSARPPFDGRAVTMLELDHGATALGSGFGSLWLGDNTGRLLRINPADMTVIATLDLGGIPCGPIVPAALSIWVTTCGIGVSPDGSITVRVDPSTNAVANRYEEGGGDGIGMWAMNGLVWFISDVQAGRLTAVDAASGAHVRDLAIGVPIRHLAAGFGSLWASPIGRPVVLRLDPETGGQQAEIALSGDSSYLATAGDAIWVAEPHQWLVGRIDPVTDRLAAELGASPGVDHLEIASSGLLWALADAEAVAFDPTAVDRFADQFPVPVHVGLDGVTMHVLAIVDETAWFADGLQLVRLGPR